MDDVEERGEPVDLVQLACERRGEVEAEAVDVALGHEVAQRVHDQPQHRGMHDVEAVAGAGEVEVVAGVVRHQPVVGGVVDALERQHRPQVVALGGVVVDDVEDHLEAGGMQRLDHLLELAYLLARAGGGVAGVRSEVADRRIAPVVRAGRGRRGSSPSDVVDRQQLDGGHAEVGQVGDRLVGGESGVGAAQLLGFLHSFVKPLTCSS